MHARQGDGVVTGTVLRIERHTLHDGPGIRTTVFFKGCPLRCAWCHSPESQSPLPELLIRTERCLGCGDCVSVCPNGAIVATDRGVETRGELCARCGACTTTCPACARELVGLGLTVEQVMAEVERDIIFYDRSGGGVTFSGGEPLMQPAFLEALLDSSRAAGIHTAVDTCGSVGWDVLSAMCDRADLFLFDVKLVDDERHRRFTGVSNRPILDNLTRLASRHCHIRVRFPLIPGVNDDRHHIQALGAFVASIGLSIVDVLPYHRAGIAKYARFDKEYALCGAQPPSADAVESAVHTLERYGLQVQAGG